MAALSASISASCLPKSPLLDSHSNHVQWLPAGWLLHAICPAKCPAWLLSARLRCHTIWSRILTSLALGYVVLPWKHGVQVLIAPKVVVGFVASGWVTFLFLVFRYFAGSSNPSADSDSWRSDLLDNSLRKSAWRVFQARSSPRWVPALENVSIHLPRGTQMAG